MMITGIRAPISGMAALPRVALIGKLAHERFPYKGNTAIGRTWGLSVAGGLGAMIARVIIRLIGMSLERWYKKSAHGSHSSQKLHNKKYTFCGVYFILLSSGPA